MLRVQVGRRVVAAASSVSSVSAVSASSCRRSASTAALVRSVAIPLRRSSSLPPSSTASSSSSLLLLRRPRRLPPLPASRNTVGGNVTASTAIGTLGDVWLARSYATSYPPFTKLGMPALSPTMTAGNVGAWLKNVGDKISPGDVLVEIETDKATMDFECQEEGYLAKILVPKGTKDVKIGTVIAILAERQEDVAGFESFTLDNAPSPPSSSAAAATAAPTPTPAAAPLPPAAVAKPTPAPAPIAPTGEGRIFASPLAKKLAEERGISLSSLRGTGPGGRIVKSDVDGYVPAAAAAAGVAPSASAPLQQPGVSSPYLDIPLSNMRQIIASRLQESKQTIPHYYLTVDVNMDRILEVRKELNEQGKKKNFSLSVNDFVIQACSRALLKVPQANSAWHQSFIRQYTDADISVAVATPNGLITPIIFGANKKGLVEISATMKDLAERAKIGRLTPNEYQGGTFTISNLGMYGIKSFTAIINPPQSCILAVGGYEKRAVPDDKSYGGVTTANIMSVTLSCDHRVVDGAVGAQWVSAFKGYMEDPLTMLL